MRAHHKQRSTHGDPRCLDHTAVELPGFPASAMDPDDAGIIESKVCRRTDHGAAFGEEVARGSCEWPSLSQYDR